MPVMRNIIQALPAGTQAILAIRPRVVNGGTDRRAAAPPGRGFGGPPAATKGKGLFIVNGLSFTVVTGCYRPSIKLLSGVVFLH
jgi:hypothetical protein